MFALVVKETKSEKEPKTTKIYTKLCIYFNTLKGVDGFSSSVYKMLKRGFNKGGVIDKRYLGKSFVLSIYL